MSYAAGMAMAETPHQRLARTSGELKTMQRDYQNEFGRNEPIEINAPDTELNADGEVVKSAGAAKAAGGGGTAALIALQLYSQAKKAQFADKQARYKAHLDQRNAMSNALDSLIGTTRSLRL